MSYQITPETELEKRIIFSPEFQEAAQWGRVRPGHPEGTIGKHVENILAYLDRANWPECRRDLRVLALLHDLGKPQTRYSGKGHLISEPASIISERIARQFIDDEGLLTLVRIHDKYFGFYRKWQEGRGFNEEHFRELYARVNIPLLIRFTYADSCEREKDSTQWLQGKLVECDLLKPEDIPELPKD